MWRIITGPLNLIRDIIILYLFSNNGSSRSDSLATFNNGNFSLGLLLLLVGGTLALLLVLLVLGELALGRSTAASGFVRADTNDVRVNSARNAVFHLNIHLGDDEVYNVPN
jgi:hypothetical protein